MRVLVVDDSRVTRKAVRMALEGLGAAVREILEATDGAEALDLLRNENLGIELVLMDWNMPRLDGLGFLKGLRSLGLSRDVAVIMVTGENQKTKVAESLRWGARDYLLKPFTAETLQQKVRQVLAKRDAARSGDTTLLLSKAAAGPGPQEEPRLSAAALVELAAWRGTRLLAAGEILIRAGQAVGALHIVVRGELRSGGDGEPRGPGQPVAEHSFLLGQPADRPVVAAVDSAVVQIDRNGLGEFTRRCPEMGHFLAGIVRRSSSAPREEAAPAFSGTLKAIPLMDLIQILHLCKKTGHLKLAGTEASGGLYIEEGSIRQAWSGERRSEEALFELTTWTEGSFTFESGVRTELPPLETPTLPLLLEAARRLDERRRQGAP